MPIDSMETSSSKLRELAFWYREFAERAGNQPFGRLGCARRKSSTRRLILSSAPKRAAT
jgi:hypothetical protein